MSQHDRDESPEPDPDRTPGLEPGGGVPPGETPPASSSANEGLAHVQRAEARPMKWVWLVVTGIVVLLVMLFFGALAVGIVSW